MTPKFKLHALSAAIMGSLFATAAIAQEDEPTIADEAIEEELVVTGIRNSIKSAVEAKRLAESISDSIHAEDVGKSTDQNIADALSRVTGVSVTEDSGEGARITVRGASPSMNVISVNGVELTGGLGGTGDDAASDNSVDLSSFSADILSSINVVKTAAADQNEGSLGANIELNTLKPLSLQSQRRVLTAEGRHNEFRGSNDYRVSGSFADKFFDDTLGVVVTVTADENKTREDRINNAWSPSAYVVGDPAADNTGQFRTARDLNGRLIRLSENGVAPTEIEAGNEVVAGDSLSVLGIANTTFSTDTTDRERVTANFGIQWQPTDMTDIQLDVTHTDRTVTNEFISFNLGYGGNRVESDDLDTEANGGPVEDGGTNYVTEWNTIDLDNYTLRRSFGRGHQGSNNKFNSERDLETNVVSLRLDQMLTDTLSMKLRAGFSETTDELVDGVGVNTATWGTVAIGDLPESSALINPVGYDCIGSNCSYQTGSTHAQFDPVFGLVTDVTTRYNPFDLNANHMGGVTWRTNTQTDTNKSLNLDFDWDIDRFGLTTLEFGAKYASREKDVQTQNETLTTGTVLIDRQNPDIEYATTGMQNIRLGQMVSDESFPYDDFLDGLGVDRSQVWVNGWPLVDTDKALELLSSRDPNSVGRNLRDDGSRNITTDTTAAYVKVNFEGLDGRLTGNVGLRYVEDENEAVGFGSATFARNNWFYNAEELFIDRQLANTSAGACPREAFQYSDSNGNAVEPGDTNENGTAYFLFDPDNADTFQNCWDWRLTHAYIAGQEETYPVDENGNWRFTDNDGNPVYEVNRLFAMDYSGATPEVIQNDGLPLTIVDPTLWDYDTWLANPTDSSITRASNTDRFRHFNLNGLIYGYGDHSTSFTGPRGNDPIAQNRTSQVADSAKQSLLLPSLTLNYQLNDDMIVRFAASKTMTRPQADQLNPRLSINENVWEPQDNGNSGNTQLKPLKSKNLDFSFEWYFGEIDVLSIGLFHKDMTDFPQPVQSFFHYENVRSNYDIEDLGILMPLDNSRTSFNSNCQVERSIGNFNADTSGWGFDCRRVLIEQQVNGSGTTINGVEIGYTQEYPFLPGLLSNMGLSANYTYQDSESDEETTADGRVIEPLPQEWTPKHAANFTLFWENDNLQLRLANRYTGVQLVDGGLSNRAVWKDATNRLDFSANYRINDMFTITFNALNLTDETHRTFVTANETVIGQDADGNDVLYTEDWGFNSSVYDGRTANEWKNGRQFRLGIRANF